MNRVLSLPVYLASVVFLGGVLIVLGLASVVLLVGGGGPEWERVRAMLALASAIVPLATAVTYLTSRRIVHEIRFVVRGVDSLAKGQRGHAIAVRTLDEIGALTRRFELLREHGNRRLRVEQQAKEQAKRTDRFRAAALTSLSHELRTPLNAVLGFSDVLLDEIDGPLLESQREDVEVIRNAGLHLNDLFNDVIDISAAAGGDLPLNLERVSLAGLLEALVREQGIRVDAQAVDLQTVGFEGSADVVADSKRLRQIFGNLLSNAVKFTEQGWVRVVLSESETKVSVRFEDTGPGIAPEDQERVFAEFQQSGALPRRRAGSGLGLSIAKYLTERHEGEISLSSVLGEGSVFCVTLPKQGPNV